MLKSYDTINAKFLDDNTVADAELEYIKNQTFKEYIETTSMFGGPTNNDKVYEWIRFGLAVIGTIGIIIPVFYYLYRNRVKDYKIYRDCEETELLYKLKKHGYTSYFDNHSLIIIDKKI